VVEDSPRLPVVKRLGILPTMSSKWWALAWMLCGLAGAAVPAPESVLVLFNSAVPESGELAAIYQKARNIPGENLIGLDLPIVADITREDYRRKLEAPLRAELDRRGLWLRKRDREGVVMPQVSKVQVLAIMKGVPLRIKPASGLEPVAPSQTDPLKGHDEAAVDSELAMLGVEGLPTEGALPNKFYQSKAGFQQANLPFLLMTGRIDAPTYAICKRMIADVEEIEKTGLWGMACVDIANKFPQGDQWLETVAKRSVESGFPTILDRFDETLPKNYPLTDAALYFGWYDWHVSGPFVHPQFQFRKGAVAVHLHSFSAAQLGNAGQNWCAPLLARGAAVTLGNVYEPYLHLTHDLGILHERLLEGDCWAEAGLRAMPVVSWQGVLLGDPLYRPFRHLAGTGVVKDADRDYRALRAASMRWKNDPAERRKQLDAAAERTRSPVLAEAVGLDFLNQKLTLDASVRFKKSKLLAIRAEDKARQDLHQIAIDRANGNKTVAIRGLRDALTQYSGLPVAESFSALLKILDPPPPPAPKPAPPKGQ